MIINKIDVHAAARQTSDYQVCSSMIRNLTRSWYVKHLGPELGVLEYESMVASLSLWNILMDNLALFSSIKQGQKVADTYRDAIASANNKGISPYDIMLCTPFLSREPNLNYQRPIQNIIHITLTTICENVRLSNRFKNAACISVSEMAEFDSVIRGHVTSEVRKPVAAFSIFREPYSYVHQYYLLYILTQTGLDNIPEDVASLLYKYHRNPDDVSVIGQIYAHHLVRDFK